MYCVFSQGQFSINLIGTGLKVSESNKWTSQGNYVSVKVHRSEVRGHLNILDTVVFTVNVEFKQIHRLSGVTLPLKCHYL